MTCGIERSIVGLEGEPGRGRVEPGADHLDDAALLQVPDPVQGRGGGQADRAGQLHVGHIGIRLEQGQQVNVNIIKVDGHSTE